MCAPTEDDLPRRPRVPTIDVETEGCEGFQVGPTDAEEKRRRDRRGDIGMTLQCTMYVGATANDYVMVWLYICSQM